MFDELLSSLLLAMQHTDLVRMEDYGSFLKVEHLAVLEMISGQLS